MNDYIYCPYCGTKLNSECFFCSECGQRIKDEVITPIPSLAIENRVGKGHLVLPIVGISINTFLLFYDLLFLFISTADMLSFVIALILISTILGFVFGGLGLYKAIRKKSKAGIILASICLSFIAIYAFEYLFLSIF